jgi:hypothetical protein
MLDLDHPSNNPRGIFVIKAVNATVGDELMDVVSIYMTVPDPVDHRQKRYSARLENDGAALRITYPSADEFVLSMIDDIHDQEDVTDFCESTKNIHKSAAAEMMKPSNIARRTKDMVLLFPSGITVSNEHFNKRKSPEDTTKVKGHFRMVLRKTGEDEDGKDIGQLYNYVRYKFVLTGSARPLLLPEDDSSDEDEYAEAARRMSMLRMTDDNNEA